MGKQRIKPNYRRRVLRLPDLDHCKLAVLNSLGSPASRRVYEYQSFFPFRSKLLHTAARFPGRPLGAREAVSAPIDAAFEIEDWLH